MITCPVCGNAITLPTAIETLIDRGGVYGRRVTCPACRCVFSTITRVLRPSPLSPKQLEQIRNQPR